MASAVFTTDELADELTDELCIGLSAIQRAAAMLQKSALESTQEDFLKDRLEFTMLVADTLGLASLS